MICFTSTISAQIRAASRVSRSRPVSPAVTTPEVTPFALPHNDSRRPSLRPKFDSADPLVPRGTAQPQLTAGLPFKGRSKSFLYLMRLKLILTESSHLNIAIPVIIIILLISVFGQPLSPIAEGDRVGDFRVGKRAISVVLFTYIRVLHYLV